MVNVWAIAGCIAALAVAVLFWIKDADWVAYFTLKRLPSAGAFKDKRCWIVGASSGIGEALAFALARQGAFLILSARRVDRLMGVAEECRKLGAAVVEVYRLDVEDFDSHPAIAKVVVDKVGRIDYLINNAGRSQRALLHETALSVDQDIFKLNVFGVISVTKAVLPYMMKQRSGHIVNTSSVSGKVGAPVSAAYSGTKFAIQGYFDALRMEMGMYNICVTNVCPGPVMSEITLNAFTANPGQKFGQLLEGNERMPAERCADYMVAAMWAKLPEIWVAYNPILTFVYLAQYLPFLYHWMSPHFGKKRVMAFKQGDSGYSSLWSFGAKKEETATAAPAASGTKSE